MKKSVVFIHGMYMTALCWENWVRYFQERGYDARAIAWPGRDRTVEALNAAHPEAELGRLTLRAVVDDLEQSIRKLEPAPALVGHSMGGLVVQLLLGRGVGAAGVAIDSAAPAGLFSPQWSFLRSNFPHINPLAPQGTPIRMSFERFQYAFANGLPLEVQRGAYERYVVPESRRVPAGSLGADGRIDFRKPHAPLLLIGGGADHIIPPALNRANARRYSDPTSITDYREFPGRTHLTIAQPDWESVAAAVCEWLAAHGE